MCRNTLERMWCIYNSKRKDTNGISFCFTNASCGSTEVEKSEVKGLHSHGNKGGRYRRKDTREGKDHYEEFPKYFVKD